MAAKSVDAKTALRQLMKQEKQKRIDSPLAKYTNTGQLCCALCNQQLTSETFWKAHVNGREHKQKLLELKSNIKQSNTDAIFAKPLPPSPANNEAQRGVKRSHDVANANDRIIIGKPSASVPSTTSAQHSALPADFFDSDSSKAQLDTPKYSTPVTITAAATTNAVPSVQQTSTIPEGFFDDPQVDARMRKVEYVDKMEVEWDAFTRQMKQETNISEKLEAEDDIERDVEREIKETDELITRWKKIEEMHDLKDNRFKTVVKGVKPKKKSADDDKDDDEDNEELEKELQNMYNWRQKRS
ncbi:unnamed protein product [Adineta ricciae]|uniref:Zinc finger protein 830 n=1 Tax=Adineta ricciae TaxID=249248 RepID=A0A816E6K5_ADIRI|nr:unnamed protein product [Adineta ricciae]